MRDASVSHTQIHIPVHTCLGIGGGVSHCQLLSWIHTESKTTTHAHYTRVQMWLQQEPHILVHARPCNSAPSVRVGHRCVTSEMLKSSICL